MTDDFNKIITIDEWRSPVSDYPISSLGKAKIAKHRNGAKAWFFCEGVKGYLYYKYSKPAYTTTLKISNRIWMTDQPPYTWSLQSYAERSSGDVLVAGLGLGIVVHFLCGNPAVKSITVIDHERDVIKLVKPLLPKDPRLSVVHDDFYRYMFADEERRDVLIWDLGLWAGGKKSFGRDWIGTIEPVARAKYGDQIKVFRHGLDRDIDGQAWIEKHGNKFYELKRMLGP